MMTDQLTRKIRATDSVPRRSVMGLRRWLRYRDPETAECDRVLWPGRRYGHIGVAKYAPASTPVRNVESVPRLDIVPIALCANAWSRHG
jgi:hypothetical protein